MRSALIFASRQERRISFFKISDLYPGLTPAEKALAAEKPIDSLKAYRLSWKAEEICLKEFPRSASNDESDACRHFVWATLLSRVLGAEAAQSILDAHEQEPTQPPEEKAMDLANNQRGVTFATTEAKTFSDEEILGQFRNFSRKENSWCSRVGEENDDF
jgi:hypothetical protein